MNLFQLGAGRARPLVIGHRGAAAVAPENTLASLRAAVELGVDVVEFDVAPGLVLLHSERERPIDVVHLEDALAVLGSEGVGLHVDVKQCGYERDVAQALERHQVDDRSFISSAWPSSLRAFAQLAPQIPLAITYPRDRYGVSRAPWPAVAGRAGASALRRAMPIRIRQLVRGGLASAVSLHWRLCSAATIASAHAAGAAVIAWTVNDVHDAQALAAMGVDAIVTDDPRAAAQALATLTAR